MSSSDRHPGHAPLPQAGRLGPQPSSSTLPGQPDWQRVGALLCAAPKLRQAPALNPSVKPGPALPPALTSRLAPAADYMKHASIKNKALQRAIDEVRLDGRAGQGAGLVEGYRLAGGVGKGCHLRHWAARHRSSHGGTQVTNKASSACW